AGAPPVRPRHVGTLARIPVACYQAQMADASALQTGAAGVAVPANYHFRQLHCLITSRRNFTCGMGSIIHQGHEALSEQQVRSLIEEADRLGFDEFEISGGEPYYLPYFRQVLQDYAGRTQMTLKVCTNGFHLDEELIQNLAGRPRLHFQVSFDGTGAIHNAIRVQNRYDA